MKQGLIIIDVQKDYFKGGRFELYEPEKVCIVIQKLLEYFRSHNLPIYFIQHLSSQGAVFFDPTTEGIDIHKDIKPQIGEKVITKHFPNSFLKTTLLNDLKKDGVTNLIICGMMTHMCVDSTVRAAKDHGYTVTLISNACATKNVIWNGKIVPAESVQQVCFAALNKVFATVVTDEDFFAEKIN